MPRRCRLAALAATCTLGLAACAGDESASDGRVRVVASTTQIADLARQVGGERVEVTSILRAGTDVHDFEPRPSDAKAFAEADVVLVNGQGLDPWADDLAENAGGDATVVDLSQGLPVGGDRHWWSDPRNGAAAVKEIARALGDAAPRQREAFAAASRAHRVRVDDVDAAIGRCLRAIPAAQRKLVTNHEAFGLFARRYGIEVVGAVIPATSTQAQASAGELAALRETIRDEGVTAVFPESSVKADVAQALAREAGVRSDLVLYGDSLGADGTGADTYLGMLAANADTLARGFTGDQRRCRIPTR